MSKNVRSGGRIPLKVKDACKAFMVERKLPIGQYGILLNLAIKSYKNLSLEDRDNWSLQEVIAQGL